MYTYMSPWRRASKRVIQSQRLSPNLLHNTSFQRRTAIHTSYIHSLQRDKRKLMLRLLRVASSQIAKICFYMYSRVHKRWQSFFSKILEKSSIVKKKMIPHIKGLDFSQRWSKKKFKMADLENSKWPPQKNLVFQLRQFSIFFYKNLKDWSLG